MSGLIFSAFVIAFLLIAGFFAYLPTVLFCVFAPIAAYCVRAWHPMALALLFSVYAGIPILIWYQAGIATERAEKAYQADVNALARQALPPALPETMLVKTSDYVAAQDFYSLSCSTTALPVEAYPEKLQRSRIIPARYLLLDLSPDNPCPSLA
ncbi:hypothetical protein [Rhizobium sp. BG4]|uniref:hypothetical protein n=1 Tax=Rhizobium sp. BG4 TaxID=2613770 RepID=UPI00193D9F3F|nr:hypothetical protein [Rhizobium sp. BG4]QRM46764.1 hypothetical protein F2982_25820 [Rhizobium sp. BG4]